MKYLALFSLLIGCACGRYASRADIHVLNKCADGLQEFADCLKYKTIKFLDRVIVNTKPIPLANFLYLTHDDGADNATKNELPDEEAILTSADVDNKLTEVLMRRLRQLATTKNLQIKLDPDIEQGEGRKKDKDKGGQMMMMVGAGAMMMHAAMSKIAFIAGKALIVAKIALVISAVVGLKKLLSSDDNHESTQVIYKQAESGHGGGGWHRSIDGPDNVHAHRLAYNGQVHES